MSASPFGTFDEPLLAAPQPDYYQVAPAIPGKAGVNVVLIDERLPDSSWLFQSALTGSQVFGYDSATQSAADVLSDVIDWDRAANLPIQSISLLAHGQPGEFALGDEWINTRNIGTDASLWQQLGSLMAPAGSINLYGCDVAATGSSGQTLIDDLNALTGANVYASTNTTGAGGDWTLEAASNATTTAWTGGCLNPSLLQSYSYSLGDTLVNSTTAGVQATNWQSARSVASDANGNSVVVWSDSGLDGSGYGVFGQRFDANGMPVGNQFQVNTYTLNDQTDATVAMNASGAFVVSWSSFQQDGAYWGTYAQCYDATGARVRGEFLVNTTTAENDRWSMPAINPDGSFAIAWTDGDSSTQTAGIRAQRYSAAGVPLGGQMQVNTYTPNDQEYPSIAALPNDGFVIVWSSWGEDGSGFGVYGQRFDANGNYVGTEFRVNTYTVGDQWLPQVAADPAGNFVVTWTSQNQDGSGYGVYAQAFAADGAPVGSEFRVNTFTPGDQAYSSIAMDSLGHYLITWTSYGQDAANTAGIFGQWFYADGLPLGSEFQINVTAAGDQQYSSVTISAGMAIVDWSGNGPGDPSGVFLQRLQSPFNVPPQNSVPGAQSTSYNTPLVFIGSNALSVSDVDADGCVEQVTVSVTHGTVALNGNAGLTLVSGAFDSNSFTVSGTLSALNAALAGMTYTPDLNYVGADTLSLMTNDPGNTGVGGAFVASSQVPLNVLATATTTTIIASSSPTLAYGAPVTVTATVAAAGGAPGGTITFMDGTAVLGSSPLNGSGQAIATFTTLATGQHSIAAIYSGDGHYLSSSSALISEQITPAQTATTVFASTSTSIYGEALSLTATVSTTGLPTGTVSFYDGSTLLGSNSLNGHAQASLAVLPLTLGTGLHQILAVYSGDANFVGSTGNGTLTVLPALTTLSVAPALSTSAYGQSVNVAVTVYTAIGIPSGTVSISDGGVILGTSVLSAGQAVLAIPGLALSVGFHDITATYSGDTDYQPISSAVTQCVVPATSTTTVGLPISPVLYGEPLMVTALVSVAAGAPSGAVTFFDGATAIGSSGLDSSGQAALVLNPLTLAAGSHTITAIYGGDASFAGSQGSVIEIVGQATPSLSIDVQNLPWTYGDSASLTASVRASVGTPGGPISFFDGNAYLGTSLIDPSGKAYLTLGPAELSAGPHTIVAVYGGDRNFAGVSNSMDTAIERATTVVQFTTLPNPSIYDQTTLLTAKVTSPAGLPGGTVTFKDGNVVVAVANVDVLGNARASVDDLPAGNHLLTAVYSGDNNFISGAASVAQTVRPAASQCVLTSSATSVPVGQAVTFTGTVREYSSDALGALFDNNVLLASAPIGNGQVQFTNVKLAAGNHEITFVYGGDANRTGGSATVAVAVSAVTAAATQTPSMPALFAISNTLQTGNGSQANITAPLTVPQLAISPTGEAVFIFRSNALAGSSNNLLLTTRVGTETTPEENVTPRAQAKPPSMERIAKAEAANASAASTPAPPAPTTVSPALSLPVPAAVNEVPVWIAENSAIVEAIRRASGETSSPVDGVRATAAVGLTLTTGFVLLNIRTLYSLLGSLLFTAPVWSQLDMVNALDEMKKQGVKPGTPRKDEDDEDRVRLILG